MIKHRTFIFILSFLLVSIPVVLSAATQRGIVPVSIKDSSGNQVLLYQESHALLVGVSEYTGGWANLPGVREDLHEVKNALEQKGFNAVVVINPTRVELRDAIENFINLYGQDLDNRLIFYFAGHGHTMKASYGEEMGYFVPADAPNPNMDKSGFLATSINMESIEVYSKQVQSKHALFLFDSCFSGSIFSLSRAIPENISFKTSEPVRQFITAGSANETVPDESIFNDQLIRALNGEGDLDGDGYLTGVELGEYLNKTVINYSKGSQHPQYGKIRNPKLDKGDFVFSLLNREHIEQSVDSIIREREKLEQDRLNLEEKRKRIAALQRMQQEKRKLKEERRRLEKEQDRLARLQQPRSPLKDFAGSGGSGNSGFFSEEPILEQGFSSGSSSNSSYARQRKNKLAPPNIFAMDHTSSADFSNGKRIYNQTAKPMACKMCHGKYGDGGGKLGRALKPPPSDFTSMDTMKYISPGQMYWVIKNGSRGTAMVAHSRTLKDKEIWDVVRYIRESWVKQSWRQDQNPGSDTSFEENSLGETGKRVRVMTIATPLRIWADPHVGSRVVAQAPKGSVHSVLNETEEYYQIEYGRGQIGWISKKYSKLVNGPVETQIPVPLTELLQGKRLIVMVEGVTLKKGPGTVFPTIARIHKGEEVSFVRRTNIEFNNRNWLVVKYKNQAGYIWEGVVKWNKKTSSPELDLLKELEQLAKLDASPGLVPDIETEEPTEKKQNSSESYDSIIEKFDSFSVESEPVKVETSTARLDSSSFKNKLLPLPKAAQTTYVSMIQKKIYKNWQTAESLSPREEKVTVSFFIFPQGNIDKPFVKTSSGVENLDDLALRAVVDSAPFPKFPKELNKSNLHININFKYVPPNSEPEPQLKMEEQKTQKQSLKSSDNYSGIMDHLGSLGSKHGIRKLDKP
jgi:TonB family protein